MLSRLRRRRILRAWRSEQDSAPDISSSAICRLRGGMNVVASACKEGAELCINVRSVSPMAAATEIHPSLQ